MQLYVAIAEESNVTVEHMNFVFFIDLNNPINEYWQASYDDHRVDLSVGVLRLGGEQHQYPFYTLSQKY